MQTAVKEGEAWKRAWRFLRTGGRPSIPWRRWAGPGGACAGAPAPRRCAPRSSSSPSSSGSSPGSSWPPRARRADRAAPARRRWRRRAPPPRRSSQASTSTRGVTATSINVVFPVVAINSLAGKEGFAEDKEYNEQIPAIHLYVNQINNGGRHQRPQDQPDHRAVRPDQRRQHAVAVPAVDPGQPGRLRRHRRHRHLGGGQPALRGPAGPDPAAERLVHHDQLDQPGARPTCGGPAPTWRPCCRPWCSGA